MSGPLALKPRLTQHLAHMGADQTKRTYLVVVDDSDEARVALRFAARRASKTGGRVEVLGIVEPQDFVQFGGVQAAIEQEQRLRIEGVVSAAIGEILDESGLEANVIAGAGTDSTGGSGGSGVPTDLPTNGMTKPTMMVTPGPVSP